MPSATSPNPGTLAIQTVLTSYNEDHGLAVVTDLLESHIVICLLTHYL